MHRSTQFGYVPFGTFEHVPDYSIQSLQKSLANHGVTPVPAPSSFVVAIGKGLARLGLRRHFWSWKDRILLVALMGEQEYRFFPYGCCFECVFYCYDCWPSRYDWWQSLFARYRTRAAFFSAKNAATEFERRCPEMYSLWLPEAADPTEYILGNKLIDRPIHVLELGRRYERIHEQLQPYLKIHSYRHLYEPAKGTLIFPTKSALVRGLSEAMISLCFPCSMTHPERSGTTETVTYRFFESMASGCLIVGHCPNELIDLFGYNPVVELSPETCVEDIQQILDNIEQYQDLVDRNYRMLMDKGTWDARAAALLEALEGIYR
jgi:glycosyltransferase involved in cell wall biosynthesis